MWQVLVRTTRRWLDDLGQALNRPNAPVLSHRPAPSPERPPYRPLQAVRLTDGTARTLFEEFAVHRAEARGDEETGWVLLGLRDTTEAVVLATLPAGALRDASATHVRFNSTAQAVGSRVVRQSDKRLTILGVVHTHPGSLRHPSDGDFRGDSQWVRHLRGREGIFGIGTADACRGQLFAEQPRPNVQALGELCFSWYALGADDRTYRPLPVSVTLGPDLARPLHCVWPALEAHADELERLFRQQSGVTVSVTEGQGGPSLGITLPLAEPQTALRVVIKEKAVRYYLIRGGEVLASECGEERIDRGVYLLLAELAAAG